MYGKNHLVVTGVTAGEAADRAGLRVHDVLVSYAKKPVASSDELGMAMHSAQGEMVPIEYERNGVRRELMVPAGRLGIFTEVRNAPTPEQLQAQQAEKERLSSFFQPSLKAVFERYIGSWIYLNYDDPTKTREAELVDAQQEFFTVRTKATNELRRIPYTQILQIVEDANGGLPTVLIFHLVIYKGAIGFGFSF